MICPNCGNNVVDSMKFCSKCGTPVTNSPYVPPASPTPPVWTSSANPPVKEKSRVGKILLIVGIIIVVLVSGIGIAVYFGARSYIRSTRSSAAYALAESTLRSSHAVQERMGEIKNIGIPIGTTKDAEDGASYAAFTMSVEGEKASGQYVVVMDKRNSKWRVQNAVVRLQSGEEIKIVDDTKSIPDSEPSDVDTEVNENQNTETENSNNSNNSNRKPKVISGGVLNGKATNLPKPAYPASAKAAHAEGTVSVQVLIDEEGKVITANAVSGHPLLRASAVAAARQARFSPTLLAGTPVKVSGVINYNFVAEP